MDSGFKLHISEKSLQIQLHGAFLKSSKMDSVKELGLFVNTNIVDVNAIYFSILFSPWR